MGISAVDARRPQHPEFFAIKEQIQGSALAMAAFNDHGLCSHGDDSARCFFDLTRSAQLHPGELFRFRQIGRQDCREWNQKGAKSGDSIFLNQQVSGSRHHDRVDDDIFKPVLLDLRRDRFDDRRIGEHAGLDRMRADIFHHCIYLFRHKLGFQRQDLTDTDRVLCGNRGDC